MILNYIYLKYTLLQKFKTKLSCNMVYFIIVLALCNFIMPASAHEKLAKSHYWKLYKDLFTNSGYEKRIWPVANDSTPVHVDLLLWFKQILKVDEVDQILTVYCWIEEYWVDNHLQWNPSKYGGLTSIHVPADDLWKPDILVYNSANMNIKQNELATNAIVKSNGQVILFKSVITDIACQLDMAYFPFDQQVCDIIMASWSMDGSRLILRPKIADTLTFYIENSEWSLLDFKYRSRLQHYECCPEPFSDIIYYFVMQRNPKYYILSLIIPSAFITIVTFVGFFIPHSSTGETTEKVSLGVTALLSLAIILLMVADKMPATSKVMPLIGKYYIGLIFLIFAATCVATMTMSLQLRGNEGIPLKPQLRKLFFQKVAKYMFMRVSLPKGVDLHDEWSMEHVNEQTQLLQSPTSYETVEDLPANQKNNRKRRNQRTVPACANNLSEVLLQDLADTVEEIRSDLSRHERADMIRKEWEQLTRIVERMCMMGFIGLTLLFAIFMLTTRGPPIILTEELMKKPLND